VCEQRNDIWCVLVVLWTVRSSVVWRCYRIRLWCAQVLGSYRFSETESLKVQYSLVRIYSTAIGMSLQNVCPSSTNKCYKTEF